MSKRFLSALLSLLFFFPLYSPQSFANAGQIVELPVEHVFIPQGFDSNDNVEVMVKSYLPSLCYQMEEGHHRVEGDKIIVGVKGRMIDARSPFCAQVIVPFTQLISIGNLNKGNYQIVANQESHNEFKANLTVTDVHSENVDNYLYAMVQSVQQKKDELNTIYLVGENPSSCFTLDRVEKTFNGKDTYALMPVLKQTSATCAPGAVPFSYKVELPLQQLGHSVLIHVRTMHGGAINYLIVNGVESATNIE